MLTSLSIRDLLLIDRLELEFQPGLNVLTGETGAGKSILLGALGFVLGWRGRGDVVRAGAERGEAIATFVPGPGHPVRQILEEAGFDPGEELILRRQTTAEGRRQAWINDRRASAEILRRVGEALVELHGQSDDRGLLNPSGHRAMLDAYAGTGALLAETGRRWAGVEAARDALAQAQERIAAARKDEEYLRHAVAELQQLDPQPGEEPELDQRRRAMQAADRIREDVARAAQALGPEGAEGPMADALRWLEGAAARAEGLLDPAISALGRSLDALAEAEMATTRALETLSVDGPTLEAVEERLFAIRALARKHNVLPDDLPALTRDLEDRLAQIEGAEEDLKSLRQAVEEARAAYDAAADRLSRARQEAASRLDQAMAAELPPLRLERAMFVTRVMAAADGPAGRDAVSFEVATNPGAPPGPLARIASGGELSRFLLALKVCLAGGDEGKTMIFDEIDRGVGGATADAVGRRLAALGEQGQVLAVTHSPQVAARATHHWRVAKTVQSAETLTVVEKLEDDARLTELARMLAGDRITPEARAAARALLEGG